MPEVLWKAYIDFEMENEEFDRARALYRRLLERTKHVRVWISFAKFEVGLDRIENARNVYKEASQALKPVEHVEAACLLPTSVLTSPESFVDRILERFWRGTRWRRNTEIR